MRFQYEGRRSDLLTGRPVTADTPFMAASSTKALTAAAVLQLVESGRVRLDDPLTAYYPGHPCGDAVTVRRLLNQTSGIANPMPANWLHLAEEHARFDVEAALRAALRRYGKLRFPPGERYAYSNISYWLLGKVIETASGLSYARYAAARAGRRRGRTGGARRPDPGPPTARTRVHTRGLGPSASSAASPSTDGSWRALNRGDCGCGRFT